MFFFHFFLQSLRLSDKENDAFVFVEMNFLKQKFKAHFKLFIIEECVYVCVCLRNTLKVEPKTNKLKCRDEKQSMQNVLKLWNYE